MNTLLNNPAWNALITGNKTLASGNGSVRYFDAMVSPIVGLEQLDALHTEYLHEQVPDNTPRLIFTPGTLEIPSCWKVLKFITGYQMVHNPSTLPAFDTQDNVVSLGSEHVLPMIELTRLTVPGPFDERTIEFGHYEGIIDDGKLVAMAGQRLHVGNYTEISAVCTHPDYLCKGYARQLLVRQINRMLSVGNTPFLHVRDDNARAIQVYKSLGFEISSVMNFYFIQKD